ncbi:MAG: ATP-binding protein [Bacteroidota bacterium]
MSIKIAVLSGKGGTGKTTIAVNLAYTLSHKYSVQLLDADVEEPNSYLFFDFDDEMREEMVSLMIPKVDTEKCTKCGLCGQECQFGAINVYDSGVLVFKNLCHGCGVCSLVCPENAIQEVPKELGVIRFNKTDNGISFGEGILNVGEISGVKVISELKHHYDHSDVIIIDSPPGSSCPVVETLRDIDYALVVTEDSAFGLHDMETVIAILQEMGIAYSIIINKDRDDSKKDKHNKIFEQKYSDSIALRIPLDKKIANLHSNGQLFVKEYPKISDQLLKLYHQIIEEKRFE